MLFPFLRSAPSCYHGVFSVHLLHGLVQCVSHHPRFILVDGKKKFLGLKSIGESRDQDFVIDFVNQKGLFIDPSYI